LAVISHVFTITYVAEMLGEDEDWLHELSIDMFPEDGCLHVCRGSQQVFVFAYFFCFARNTREHGAFAACRFVSASRIRQRQP
jgi:hypothetical protein